MNKNKIIYIIPVVLSLVITIGLVRLIPVLSTEYLLELVETSPQTQESYIIYEDLDQDGNSEIISVYYNAAGNVAVSLKELDFSSINQFNLPGQLLNQGPILDIFDVNEDSIRDILICTEKNDSLFLNVIDDLYTTPTRHRVVFIDHLNQMNDQGDYLYSPGQLSDLSWDGSPEYVFAISGGHALQPRRVYAVEIQSGIVSRSPVSGAAVTGLDLFDLDGDGGDEILLTTVAPENFKVPVPYRDSVSWMMILDGILQFFRPPVSLLPAPSRIFMEPFVFNDTRYLLVYHNYWGDGDYPSVLSIYDSALNPVRQRQFFEPDNRPDDIWRIPGKQDITDVKILMDTRVYTVNFNLEFTDSIDNGVYFGSTRYQCLDLDRDGEKEIISIGGFRLSVFDPDLLETAGIDIHWNNRRPRILMSMIEIHGKDPLLFIQIDQDTYTLDYSRSGWYSHRLAVYPAIFLALFLLFCLMILVQQKMIEKKYEKDRLISKLQLQAIRNQLDPHFTYNALNAVGSLIYKEKKELAYQYLQGLTDMLRLVSANTSEIMWSLSEELGFIRKYLEIEKLRFREKFIYRIEVNGEDHYQSLVPKLSILTFVENAIKHGLRHKDGVKRLEIRAAGNGQELLISIEDNGIGRVAAAEFLEESTGNGIEIMKEYFKQFNEITGKSSRFLIRDLFDEQQTAAGTLVEITIQ